MSLKFAFSPHVDARTRLLVLGSLPGDISIARGEYYAHPGNAFWTLMGDMLEEDLRGRPYADRLDRLRDRGVGLWDVIASAHRHGSLDSAIRQAEERDLARFAKQLPALRAVAFNGQKAATQGRRQLAGRPDLMLIDLPSSSGAYAALPFARKAQAWRMLRAWTYPPAVPATERQA
ncbi:MAG: DNA-deoxyinosine glycosylase [Sphingobium sp.]